MPKKKHIYGGACKPIHKSRNRVHYGIYPTTKLPIRFGLVSVLFFQIFISLVLLTMPANVWAGISSLSITSADGDAIFRGNNDRLQISFTLDDRETGDDGDAYVVTANDRFIRRGTVLKNQTVRISWDGGFNRQLLPDGNYTVRVVLNKEAPEPGEVLEKTASALLDATAPRISRVVANGNPNLLLTQGNFFNVPLRAITVTPETDDEGSPIDFGGEQTAVVLKDKRGTTIGGHLSYNNELTFSLGNPLDIDSENGNYTLTITLVDKAGNTFQSKTGFTFDNVVPNLTEVATSRGTITPGTGVNQRIDFVEVTLVDNLENGISLFDSTIRLTGPAGEILGRQTFPSKDKIRWISLSPLLPKDGLHDGEYTIEVVGADKAGNQTETIRVPFIYDNMAPQLVSLSPTQEGEGFSRIGDTIYHNQPLTQIVATFDDGASGIGVDYGKSTQILFSGVGDGNGSDMLAGRTFVDRSNTRIAYVLEQPLISQDGRYILTVQVVDTIGNINADTFQFIYDTQVPTLVSTSPAANQTIANLSKVQVVLNEATSGIDFIQSTFRLTRNVEGTYVEVPVDIKNNGTDTATLTVLEPIALDGSDDGTYAIEVTPTDRTGNTGATARREFYLVSQSRPEVRLTMPETTTVNSFATIVTELINYIGPGIDFNASTLTITNPQGVLISEAKVEPPDEANNLLTWRTEAVIASDGSADGEYIITATFVDFTGQRFTQAFPLVLDTQFPPIKTVQVATETQTQLSVDSITDIAEAFTQITVAFDETANDINFGQTAVSLAAPDGTNIPLNLFDDGRAVLTLNFQTLTQLGDYALSVTPQDLAGNQSTVPFIYRFRIDVALPTVTSVLIGGKSGALVYVNDTTANIFATFADLSGVGIALAEGSSTIVVTNAEGLPAPGFTTPMGTNQLRWTPIVLPTDGSADGRYTVAVTPVNKAGRQGDVVYRQFVYDTQEPRVTATTPVTLNQPVSYISGALTQLQFTLEDVGPAGLALEQQTIALFDTKDAPIAATLTADPQNDTEGAAATFYLTLSSPFAQDGSADGEYTVKLGIVDKAGNLLDVEHTFIYDSQVPQLPSVKVDTIQPVVLKPQNITELSESISSLSLEFEDTTRIDFANTVVELLGPDGQTIPVNLSPDGVEKLTVRFVELTQVGLYTLSVMPQDVAGNVAPGAVNYRFVLDIPLPSVSAVRIGKQTGDVAYVNARNVLISATFLDSTDMGLALGEGGSSIVVTNAEGATVPGRTRANGVNELIWAPLSLPTDGSVDGRYTVAITPVDKAGRQGDVVYHHFIYDTEPPQITASSPLTLSQPVSYVGGDLSQFAFTVEDVGPASLLWASQTIELLDASGIAVSSKVTSDELTSQLYLTLSSPFAQDESADGEYKVRLSLVDKAGNRLDVEHPLVYDSRAPQLASVMVDTEPPIALMPAGIADISESINSLSLEFEDATRVDFANTSITLIGPDEVALPLTLADNGTTTLTVSFPALRQVGLYTLSVIPQDVAGNVVPGAVNYRFALDIPVPSVSSVLIGGKSGDVVFINGSDAKIIATLSDDTGAGLTQGGSSIVVTNAEGATVPGRTRANGVNELIWAPLSLPTDGSVDGRYTVAITPVDKAGRQGDVVYHHFIYDTEPPQITASSPLTLSQPVSYVGGDLSQFAFTVEDVGPASLLWASQTIELLDASGIAVSSKVTSDELTSQLYLTLSSPFAQDESADGEYKVRLSLVDKAGNRLDVEHPLVYDSRAPQLSSVMVDTEPPMALVLHRITELSESISSLSLEFEDATRIDFANTVITLMGPDASGASDEADAAVASTIPLTLADNGTTTLTAIFPALRQVGLYTLSVMPQDVAGNVASGAVNYRFVLDIPLPSVSAVIIGEQTGDVAYVNASNMLIGAILLDPTETGLALGSEGSSITVSTLDGTTVPGTTGSNETDLLVWEPLTLTSDGTTDGRYTVSVTPVDKAGRVGNTVYREFIYDTQQPQITAAVPIDLSQPASYLSQNLTQFRLTVEDVGPAELMLSDQKVSLRGESGSLIPAQLTHSQNRTEAAAAATLFFTLDEPLPLDGSMDGKYTIVIELSDKAGNVFAIEHLIIYDTQAPTLVSTVPADGSLITEDITQIQVNLSDEGDSGIDWTLTMVTLVAPNGSEISGELVSNGTTQLILNTNQLVEDGRYIIRVRAVDRASNGNETVFERSFLLSRRLPAIVSTEPATAPEDEAFTNEEIERIEVTLETDDENHLSTLRLLNAANQVIAGQQQRESNRLIYNLVRPLATDGSEDDIYTIEFTPISASGRSGEVQQLTFIYDTQAPEIEADEAIHLVVAQPALNNSLLEIRVNLTDNQSGIDWENLDEEWLTFERLSPDATEIAGRVDDDNQGNLTFRLTVPLADNGSADGEYRITVTPKDRAGNGDEPYQKVFTYDTSPPMIDASTLLINDAPLLVDINATDYPTAVSTTGGVVIQANIFDTGLGVNLAQSSIVVRNPDGAEISGNTQQNGVDTLFFKSDGLVAQGLYQVTVISIGNDSELLGFAPTASITTEFLYETTEPTATVTNDGGETELTDEALPLEGTAADPAGTQGERQIQASGVWLVEIVGEGPDGQPIDPVPATDDSNAEETPWTRWSVDFLPSRSGEYDLAVRVTDNAGNYAVYDIGEYTMSVSLTFRGATFGWPNPLRLSKGDVAFFSFDINVPLGETVELTLSIYDWSGDIVLSQTYPDVVSGQRNDQLIKWNLENQAGTSVARGLYVFRLEAVNAIGNRANAVGKVLVVD